MSSGSSKPGKAFSHDSPVSNSQRGKELQVEWFANPGTFLLSADLVSVLIRRGAAPVDASHAWIFLRV